MCEYALELGYKTIGITEHDTVANALKIEKAMKKYPDLKIIRGNEIYLCRDGLNRENFSKEAGDKYYHFILLAKDLVGHQQIREISTRAWMRSYKTGKMRRVPTYYQDLLEIIGANPGHVIGSTACLGGFVGTKILENYYNPADGFENKIITWLKSMQGIFGKENFFLELQPSDNKEQIIVNKELIRYSKKLNIPYIITTDAHYLKKEDAPIHSAYLRSQEGEREVDSFYATTYLMGTKEIEHYMRLTPEELEYAYQNILNIADMCEDYTLRKPLKIPSLMWRQPSMNAKIIAPSYYKSIPWLETFINSDFDGDKVMAQLLVDKFESDGRYRNKEFYDEINNNLATVWESSEVNKAHWSAYFLNLQYTLDECWKAGTLVGPGRGSGVGFTLLYMLDIIQICKLWETTELYAWRFLNPSRVSVLDVDTDIEGARRADVLAHLRRVYGEDRVANVVTFGTEGSKQAIQTAARGLGIDNDISLYIASLIPSDRGKPRTLNQCYYGDIENDFKPISLFVQQMKEYPDLWKTALRVEGLVSRVGEHAGGVIFVDEPFTNSTALMKVPNGDIVTQFDLHDCEDASLIKIDLLSVECLDKIHNCLDLLADGGYIVPEKTLRETYETYLNVYSLERKDKNMWKMVHNHEIQSLFQMEKQSGIQGIALTKPQSVDDLAVLNSVIRLMAPDPGAEQPLNKYARFKNDIKQWFREMNRYGLTAEEQEFLKRFVGSSYGIAESQEKIMALVQQPELGGFSLSWADSLRKAVAKKNPEAYDALEKEFFANVEEKRLSKNLCSYAWHVLVAMSRGYSFNASHTLAYSLVALQEMNLAFKYPIIFWNCACLITDSGGNNNSEEEIVDIYAPEYDDLTNGITFEDLPDKSGKIRKSASTDYKKIATALGKMIQSGIKVEPPNINTSNYTFTPDVENNMIVFGLSGILRVGEDVISEIIANRPYASPRDFINKVNPKKPAMISLIKGGAFDSMLDRKLCMGWYIWETCDKKKNLTLQNMASLVKYNLLPQETSEQKLAFRVYEFNRYLKSICKFGADFKLDDRAIEFIIELGAEHLIGDNNIINAKLWDKQVYQKHMDVFRNWIISDKENILQQLNSIIFLEDWKKYAEGTISAWEMEALCFYYHEHELAHLNKGKYGYRNFFELPEEPIPETFYHRGGRDIPIYELCKICGTCIAKDKAKATATILTTNGVVEVKFRKEYFSMFDKRISQIGNDGKKHTLENSWFNRGEKIVVTGMRRGDQFVAKTYKSTAGHQLYKIVDITPDGDITLTSERPSGLAEEEEDV